MATLNELGDWEWQKFKDEFDIINWDTKLNGLQRVGVALIGLGRMGLVHMRNLLREPRAKLKYCFDADQIRLDICNRSVFFKDLAIRALHSDQLNVALDDPEVQAVVIAAPTTFHYELVKRSLEAGKNVMCEKPLSTNSDDIAPLYDLAKSKSVFLLTAFNRHHDADWQLMRRKLTLSLRDVDAESSIGSIQMIRIVSRNGQRPPVAYLKVSGGCFHDTCIHDFGMMLWLRGLLPESVQVVGKTWQQYYQNQPELLMEQIANPSERNEILQMTDDYFLVVITLKFPDGSLGLIDMARYSNYGNDQRCEIYGSRGMLQSNVGKFNSNVYKLDPNGCSNTGINSIFISRYGQAYEQELETFLKLTNISLNVSERGSTKNCSNVNADNNLKAQCKLQGIEYPNRTLVAAATKLADICRQAVKTGRSVRFDWDQAFERQFAEENCNADI